ncbi:MAG: CinA family nicotinamide mononucleotide deamidase-related protein [Chloroflexi bacterium]|nr:MAG: CinA family nicotinamide mononucleotide deamidase-related protein [Chloroflexota bacterium]
MHAEIVMIGTELLLGEIVDTNAARLAKGLRSIGLDLLYKTTVGDNEARITQVLNLALERSDVVITSGGLGPTVDDITRQAVANATGRKLVYSTQLERQIAARFRSFGREMADNNKRQAYIPQGAIPLRNPVGTAPCFLSEDVAGRGFIISLPGVPRELQYMLDNVVLPLLVERMGGKKVMKVRVLRTCAVGESNVDRAIGDLMTAANPTVGLAAHPGHTDVRITAKANTEAEADALIAPLEAELRARLGVAIYGEGEETVPGVVGQMLAERGLKLGVVDTLTGGELAQELRQAGFGDLLSADLQPDQWAVDSPAERAALLQSVTPPGGVGLALFGPFENNETEIIVTGINGTQQTFPGRRFKDSDYVRRWFVVQGLDWLRRTLLGQLASPADWN